jgi:hypothetical protein
MSEPVMRINLRGKIVLIDDSDAELVARYTWRPVLRNRVWYAESSLRVEGRRRTVSMHRIVLGEPACQVDHINGNGLDNRRENLRKVTSAQNCFNRRAELGGTSGFKGVTWNRAQLRWHVQIAVNGQRFHLGSFLDEIKAAQAYDAAAREFHGPFAAVNFPLANERPAIEGSKV